MDEEDLHYLGGMIDADGSMYISVMKKERAKWGFTFVAKLSVTGKDKQNCQERHYLFKQLAEENDVRIQKFGLHDGSKSTRVAGSAVIDLLEVLLPYLREKRETAEVMVNAPWPDNRYGADGQPEEEFRGMVRAREKVRELNSGTRTKYDAETLLKQVNNE
jgi:hypothetical protein